MAGPSLYSCCFYFSGVGGVKPPTFLENSTGYKCFILSLLLEIVMSLDEFMGLDRQKQAMGNAQVERKYRISPLRCAADDKQRTGNGKSNGNRRSLRFAAG